MIRRACRGKYRYRSGGQRVDETRRRAGSASPGKAGGLCVFFSPRTIGGDHESKSGAIAPHRPTTKFPTNNADYAALPMNEARYGRYWDI